MKGQISASTIKLSSQQPRYHWQPLACTVSICMTADGLLPHGRGPCLMWGTRPVGSFRLSMPTRRTCHAWNAVHEVVWPAVGSRLANGSIPASQAAPSCLVPGSRLQSYMLGGDKQSCGHRHPVYRSVQSTVAQCGCQCQPHTHTDRSTHASRPSIT